jgi:transcriptional regulator with XRE-family HTH domain
VEFYEIGQTIKKLRKDKKLTQSMLASEVGITRQTISKLEKGNIDKVSLQVFIKLLDALDYELTITEKKPFYYFDVNSL